MWKEQLLFSLEKKSLFRSSQIHGTQIYGSHWFSIGWNYMESSDIATFSGICNCGRMLRGEIPSLQAEVIKVICYIVEGASERNWEKRYLKGQQTLETAKYMVEIG